MPTIPTPLRAALGAAAVAVDTARSLPQKAIELPVFAVSGALQLSLRAQQRYAELTVRGDQVLSRVRGVPDDAPEWATFDESPVPDVPPPAGIGTSADTSLPLPQAVAEQAADASGLVDGASAGLPSTTRRRSSRGRPTSTDGSADAITTTSAAAEAAVASASRRARTAAKSAAARPARSPSSRRTTPDTRAAREISSNPALGPAEDAVEQAVTRALNEAERVANLEADAAEEPAGDLPDDYVPAPRTGQLSAFDVVDESADTMSTAAPVELPPR